MTVNYEGPEIFERVLVRQIGDQVVPGTIPLEVDGVFLRVPLGGDGVAHLTLEDLTKFVEAQKNPPVVEGPPSRATRRAKAKP